jgi:hypothetical protein
MHQGKKFSSSAPVYFIDIEPQWLLDMIMAIYVFDAFADAYATTFMYV